MSDTVFRRINGRIVPIKIKNERAKSAASAAAYGAAGAAVGVGSGKIAEAMVRRSANLENAGRTAAKQFKLHHALAQIDTKAPAVFETAAIRFGEKSIRLRIRSKALFNARPTVLNAGKLIAAGLFGLAVSDGVKAVVGKDPGKSDDFLGHIAGTAAAAATLYPYYSGLGRSRMGALKHTLKNILGKVKTPSGIKF